MPGVGLRTVKTVASVAACLVLGYLIDGQWPVFACLAAVLTTKETVENSISDGLTRIISTLIGGAAALMVLFFREENMNWLLFAAITSAGTLVTIYFTVLIKKPGATAVAAVVYLGVALMQQDDRFFYAGRRIVETIAGIVIAVLVNKFFDPKTLGRIFRRGGGTQ